MPGEDGQMYNLQMVRRTETHIIDTRAVRTVISALPDDWLLRNMEERDYGIDLLLEVFEQHAHTRKPEHYATGNLLLAQVKGQEKEFPRSLRYSKFPVKTLRYAELFPIPFLFFWVSLKAQRVRYVWLQKYIRTRLDAENPMWREDGASSVSIEFPQDNILDGSDQRILGFLSQQRDMETFRRFLEAYEWLRIHLRSIIDAGETQVARSALQDLKKLRQFTGFLDRRSAPGSEIDLDGLQLRLNNVAAGKKSVHAVAAYLEDQVDAFERFKLLFLDQEELDKFGWEASSTPSH